MTKLFLVLLASLMSAPYVSPDCDIYFPPSDGFTEDRYVEWWTKLIVGPSQIYPNRFQRISTPRGSYFRWLGYQDWWRDSSRTEITIETPSGKVVTIATIGPSPWPAYRPFEAGSSEITWREINLKTNTIVLMDTYQFFVPCTKPLFSDGWESGNNDAWSRVRTGPIFSDGWETGNLERWK